MSSTQWRASFGGLIGLDYQAVFAIADRFDLPVTRKNMAKLKILEGKQCSQVQNDISRGKGSQTN